MICTITKNTEEFLLNSLDIRTKIGDYKEAIDGYIYNIVYFLGVDTHPKLIDNTEGLKPFISNPVFAGYKDILLKWVENQPNKNEIYSYMEDNLGYRTKPEKEGLFPYQGPFTALSDPSIFKMLSVHDVSLSPLSRIDSEDLDNIKSVFSNIKNTISDYFKEIGVKYLSQNRSIFSNRVPELKKESTTLNTINKKYLNPKSWAKNRFWFLTASNVFGENGTPYIFNIFNSILPTTSESAKYGNFIDALVKVIFLQANSNKNYFDLVEEILEKKHPLVYNTFVEYIGKKEKDNLTIQKDKTEDQLKQELREFLLENPLRYSLIPMITKLSETYYVLDAEEYLKNITSEKTAVRVANKEYSSTNNIHLVKGTPDLIFISKEKINNRHQVHIVDIKTGISHEYTSENTKYPKQISLYQHFLKEYLNPLEFAVSETIGILSVDRKTAAYFRKDIIPFKTLQAEIEENVQQTLKGVYFDDLYSNLIEAEGYASKEEKETMLSWLNKKFPGFKEVDTFKDIAQTGAGGLFTKYAIIIGNTTNPGVHYHEAWHRFSQMFLSQTQKVKLYKDLQKMNLTYVDRQGNVRSTKTSSYKEIEEFLAEEFKFFEQNKDTYDFSKFESKKTFIEKLFDRVIKILNYFKGVPNKTVKEYFNYLSNTVFTDDMLAVDNTMFEELKSELEGDINKVERQAKINIKYFKKIADIVMIDVLNSSLYKDGITLKTTTKIHLEDFNELLENTITILKNQLLDPSTYENNAIASSLLYKYKGLLSKSDYSSYLQAIAYMQENDLVASMIKQIGPSVYFRELQKDIDKQVNNIFLLETQYQHASDGDFNSDIRDLATYSDQLDVSIVDNFIGIPSLIEGPFPISLGRDVEITGENILNFFTKNGKLNDIYDDIFIDQLKDDNGEIRNIHRKIGQPKYLSPKVILDLLKRTLSGMNFSNHQDLIYQLLVKGYTENVQLIPVALRLHNMLQDVENLTEDTEDTTNLIRSFGEFNRLISVLSQPLTPNIILSVGLETKTIYIDKQDTPIESDNFVGAYNQHVLTQQEQKKLTEILNSFTYDKFVNKDGSAIQDFSKEISTETYAMILQYLVRKMLGLSTESDLLLYNNIEESPLNSIPVLLYNKVAIYNPLYKNNFEIKNPNNLASFFKELGMDPYIIQLAEEGKLNEAMNSANTIRRVLSGSNSKVDNYLTYLGELLEKAFKNKYRGEEKWKAIAEDLTSFVVYDEKTASKFLQKLNRNFDVLSIISSESIAKKSFTINSSIAPIRGQFSRLGPTFIKLAQIISRKSTQTNPTVGTSPISGKQYNQQGKESIRSNFFQVMENILGEMIEEKIQTRITTEVDFINEIVNRLTSNKTYNHLQYNHIKNNSVFLKKLYELYVNNETFKNVKKAETNLSGENINLNIEAGKQTDEDFFMTDLLSMQTDIEPVLYFNIKETSKSIEGLQVSLFYNGNNSINQAAQALYPYIKLGISQYLLSSLFNSNNKITSVNLGMYGNIIQNKESLMELLNSFAKDKNITADNVSKFTEDFLRLNPDLEMTFIDSLKSYISEEQKLLENIYLDYKKGGSKYFKYDNEQELQHFPIPSINVGQNTLSENEKGVLQKYLINSIILNTEGAILYSGDLSNTKDPFSRAKASTNTGDNLFLNPSEVDILDRIKKPYDLDTIFGDILDNKDINSFRVSIHKSSVVNNKIIEAATLEEIKKQYPNIEILTKEEQEKIINSYSERKETADGSYILNMFSAFKFMLKEDQLLTENQGSDYKNALAEFNRQMAIMRVWLNDYTRKRLAYSIDEANTYLQDVLKYPEELLLKPEDRELAEGKPQYILNQKKWVVGGSADYLYSPYATEKDKNIISNQKNQENNGLMMSMFIKGAGIVALPSLFMKTESISKVNEVSSDSKEDWMRGLPEEVAMILKMFSEKIDMIAMESTSKTETHKTLQLVNTNKSQLFSEKGVNFHAFNENNQPFDYISVNALNVREQLDSSKNSVTATAGVQRLIQMQSFLAYAQQKYAEAKEEEKPFWKAQVKKETDLLNKRSEILKKILEFEKVSFLEELGLKSYVSRGRTRYRIANPEKLANFIKDNIQDVGLDVTEEDVDRWSNSLTTELESLIGDKKNNPKNTLITNPIIWGFTSKLLAAKYRSGAEDIVFQGMSPKAVAEQHINTGYLALRPGKKNQRLQPMKLITDKNGKPLMKPAESILGFNTKLHSFLFNIKREVIFNGEKYDVAIDQYLEIGEDGEVYTYRLPFSQALLELNKALADDNFVNEHIDKLIHLHQRIPHSNVNFSFLSLPVYFLDPSAGQIMAVNESISESIGQDFDADSIPSHYFFLNQSATIVTSKTTEERFKELKAKYEENITDFTRLSEEYQKVLISQIEFLQNERPEINIITLFKEVISTLTENMYNNDTKNIFSNIGVKSGKNISMQIYKHLQKTPQSLSLVGKINILNEIQKISELIENKDLENLINVYNDLATVENDNTELKKIKEERNKIKKEIKRIRVLIDNYQKTLQNEFLKIEIDLLRDPINYPLLRNTDNPDSLKNANGTYYKQNKGYGYDLSPFDEELGKNQIASHIYVSPVNNLINILTSIERRGLGLFAQMVKVLSELLITDFKMNKSFTHGSVTNLIKSAKEEKKEKLFNIVLPSLTFGEDINKQIGFYKKRNKQKTQIIEEVALIVNILLDSLKKNLSPHINLNSNTYFAYFSMIMASEDLEDTTLFINNPIVRAYNTASGTDLRYRVNDFIFEMLGNNQAMAAEAIEKATTGKVINTVLFNNPNSIIEVKMNTNISKEEMMNFDKFLSNLPGIQGNKLTEINFKQRLIDNRLEILGYKDPVTKRTGDVLFKNFLGVFVLHDIHGRHINNLHINTNKSNQIPEKYSDIYKTILNEKISAIVEIAQTKNTLDITPMSSVYADISDAASFYQDIIFGGILDIAEVENKLELINTGNKDYTQDLTISYITGLFDYLLKNTMGNVKIMDNGEVLEKYVTSLGNEVSLKNNMITRYHYLVINPTFTNTLHELKTSPKYKTLRKNISIIDALGTKVDTSLRESTFILKNNEDKELLDADYHDIVTGAINRITINSAAQLDNLDYRSDLKSEWDKLLNLNIVRDLMEDSYSEESAQKVIDFFYNLKTYTLLVYGIHDNNKTSLSYILDDDLKSKLSVKLIDKLHTSVKEKTIKNLLTDYVKKSYIFTPTINYAPGAEILKDIGDDPLRVMNRFHAKPYFINVNDISSITYSSKSNIFNQKEQDELYKLECE